MLRIALVFACLLICAFSRPSDAAELDLERGIAITDPDLLERLEKRGLSLTALLSDGWQQGAAVPPKNNLDLAAMPAMEAVFSAVKREVRKVQLANPGSGVGMLFDHFRLFDTSYLAAPFARFALVGAVQRLDRAYKQQATCGEVRLIYRLEYKRDTSEGVAMSRLPMTFNLVFKAKDESAPLTCAEIAKRWIAAGDSKVSGDKLATFLLSNAGPLSLIAPRVIDRIETNLQALRRPSGSITEFGGHAEYVLKVFDWNAQAKKFRETALENMIDRQRLIADPALLGRFKQWLFTPENVRALDDGTLLIPRDYLALGGSSFAPGGGARSGNRPSSGLIKATELAAVIQAADQPAGTLKSIKSPAGFLLRLNDVTCVGCHQSRAIGGFHFMGADNAESTKHLAENAIFVPASAHFYGDAPRRRRILEAIADDRKPSFARGFSLRPSATDVRERDRNERMNIIATGFYNGWAAACYEHPSKDASFKDWTCARDRNGKKILKCVKPHDTPVDPGHGVCMTDADLRTGDAVELGRITSLAFGDDHYARLIPEAGKPLKPPYVQFNQQIYHAAGQSGGFFGGMLYKTTCDAPFPSSAICARTAADNFNSCLAGAANFKKCFREPHTKKVGLRECDKSMPCRDDYMCIATSDKNKGACLPPYFMMQFRVDGHPK